MKHLQFSSFLRKKREISWFLFDISVHDSVEWSLRKLMISLQSFNDVNTSIKTNNWHNDFQLNSAQHSNTYVKQWIDDSAILTHTLKFHSIWNCLWICLIWNNENEQSRDVLNTQPKSLLFIRYTCVFNHACFIASLELCVVC